MNRVPQWWIKVYERFKLIYFILNCSIKIWSYLIDKNSINGVNTIIKKNQQIKIEENKIASCQTESNFLFRKGNMEFHNVKA